MSENLVQLYTTQYSTMVEMLLQQKGSKLRGRVREGSHIGKMASPINQIGAVQLKAPAGRFAPLGRQDASMDRRWVFPQDGELPQLVDSFDQLKTLVDPKNEYAANAAAAVGRAYDDAIIAAAFGTAQLGVDAGGLVPEAWAPTTYTTTAGGFVVQDSFGASAATGLTVAKIIEMKRVARHYHNDLDNDPLTLVVGSKQESDLLNQAQVVSTDFNDKPVFVDGKVTRIMGVDIIYMERLPIVTTNTRGCLGFVKSGMYLGVWQDMVNNITQRTDLSSQPWQIYTKASFGATRTQPGKVFAIDCLDTTGADITP